MSYALKRARRMNIRALGRLVMALAIAGMIVVALVYHRFSSHALGVGTLSVGLLVLGGRSVLESDRVVIARTRLWCSRVGSWLAAIAGWGLPKGRGSVVDAVVLLSEPAEPTPDRVHVTAAAGPVSLRSQARG